MRRIWTQREQAQLLEPWRPDLRAVNESHYRASRRRTAAPNYSEMSLRQAIEHDGHADGWLNAYPNFITTWLANPSGKKQIREEVGEENWESLQDTLQAMAHDGDQIAFDVLDEHRQQQSAAEGEVPLSWTHDTVQFYGTDSDEIEPADLGYGDEAYTKVFDHDAFRAAAEELGITPPYGEWSDFDPEQLNQITRNLAEGGISSAPDWQKLHDQFFSEPDPGPSGGEQSAYEQFVEKLKAANDSPTVHQVVDSQQFADWFSSFPQDQQEKVLGDSIGPLQVLDRFHDSDAYPGMNKLAPYSEEASSPGGTSPRGKGTGVVSAPGKPDWDPTLNRQPSSLDSPMFSAEDRPVYRGTGPNRDLQYLFHPNDWNPKSTSESRPEIDWDINDFEEDEVLPGMPTENRSVRMYRGVPIDLQHADAAPIRHLLFGDDDVGNRVRSRGRSRQHALPGMEDMHSSPWESPLGEDGKPLHYSPYHNPELGPLLTEHSEKTRGKGYWEAPPEASLNPNPFMTPEGLGTHWSLNPDEADNFAGYGSAHNMILPTRFVTEWYGKGEDPLRASTGGEHHNEEELTMTPGSRMKIVDVQVQPPYEHRRPGDDKWVSVWPEGHSEYRYSSTRLAALTDEQYQAYLRLQQLAQAVIKDAPI